MTGSSNVRIREPQRTGQQFVVEIGDDTLPPDHPARLLWTALGQFDLSSFVLDTRAVEGHAGRPAYSPRMMLTLWGFALYRGIIHARKIARRIETDVEFRWIAGDLEVQRTVLSDFLAYNREAMVDLFADVLGALMMAGLLFLPEHRLSQDGTKIRANAGANSFRTEQGLQTYREQALVHLKATLARLDEPPPTEREQQARERAAADMLDRVQAAMKTLQQEQARKETTKDKDRMTREVKASTTDPDARKMKFAYGGTRPGYNVQFATLGDPSGGPVTIVGVQVATTGNDKGSLFTMREQIINQLGVMPTQLLVDADHVTLADLRRAAKESLDLISPVPERWNAGSPKQDEVTRNWMKRMKTQEVVEVYRARKALSERPNAIVKALFSLQQLPVRGTQRVEGFMTLVAIMINFLEHKHLWLN